MANARESIGRTKKRRNNFKFKAPVVYLFLVAVGLYFFIHSPVFNIKYINVSGTNVLEEEYVLSLSQVRTGQNIMKIKKEEIIKRISVHPFVKDVQVKRRLPNTLEIEIIERKPVGLLVCQDGFIQVSEEGYFLSLVHDIGDYTLPVISGVSLDELPGPGQLINNAGLKVALQIIKESPASLLENIVELNIKNENHILAYTLEGIEIRLGSMDNISEKLTDLEQIIEDFKKNGIDGEKIEYLDLRFVGPPVVKRKS